MFSEPLRGGRVGVCLFLALAMLMLPGCGKVAVPDVVGMTLEAATSALTGVKLTVGTVTEVFNATVPAGQVVQQDPAAGTKIKSKSAVALVVSKGPEPAAKVAVPDVAGMTQAAAAAALSSAGLAPGTVTEVFSAAVPAGQVISQDPAAGALVAPGSAVNLVVSKGPEPVATVAVPDIVGLTQAVAAAALANAGLTVGAVTEWFSATVPAGQVISQTPAAGVSVLPGASVALDVSKGPEPVAVPDVVGLTQAVAAAALANAGLTVGVVTDSFSATVPAGQVISQNPAAGVSVAPGASVALDVSKGPEPVAVPDVVGMTQSAAAATLSTAGLTVGAVTQSFSATVPAGQVISQDPAAGVSVLPGTSVALDVSKGPEPVPAPDVVGMTRAEAETAITGAGLTVGFVAEVFSATVPAGRVISQNPPAGTPTQLGTGVGFVVSRGPAISVPDLAGMTQAEAEAALTGAGLSVGAVTEENSDTVPEGQVISQNPAAGTGVAAGSAVDFVVSLGSAPVSVPDANLAAVIRSTLGLAADTVLTGAHLLALTSLDADNSSIADLTGLEHAANLGYLRLGNNQITSLAPLDGLTAVWFLVLYENQITDLSPLAEMTAMNTLNIHSNQISDLTPLAALVNMKEMMFNYNLIMDLSPLAGLTGPDAALYLSGNPLSTDVCDTQIPALEARGVTVTHDACTTPVAVPDVTGMTQAEAMAALDAAGLLVGTVTQSVSDTVPAGRVMSQSPAAGTNAAAGSAVDIEVSIGPALVAMPDANLAAVIRSTLGLAADTVLTGAHLLALTSLDADNSSIADLTGLEHAANLSYLRLGSNQITSLAPLSGLTGIWFLVLYENQITDLSPLAGMTAMNTLNIRANHISDLTPLAALVNMKEMMFNDNLITDLSPLSGLTGPDAYLYLSGNPLLAEACDTQIPALQSAGVTIESDCL